MVATTAALGGKILCGPMYAELFRARYRRSPTSGSASGTGRSSSLREVGKLSGDPRRDGRARAAQPLRDRLHQPVGEGGAALRGRRKQRRSAFCSTRSTWRSRRRTSGARSAAPASTSSISIPARTIAARRARARSTWDRGPRCAEGISTTTAPSSSRVQPRHRRTSPTAPHLATDGALRRTVSPATASSS